MLPDSSPKFSGKKFQHLRHRLQFNTVEDLAALFRPFSGDRRYQSFDELLATLFELAGEKKDCSNFGEFSEKYKDHPTLGRYVRLIDAIPSEFEVALNKKGLDAFIQNRSVELYVSGAWIRNFETGHHNTVKTWYALKAVTMLGADLSEIVDDNNGTRLTNSTIKRTLKVGYVVEPPYLWEEDGKPVGPFIEIIDQYAQAKKLKVDYQIISCAEIINKVESREIDMALPLFRTFARKRVGIFACEIYVATISALSSKEDFEALVSPDELHDKDVTFATCEGEVGDEYVSHIIGSKNPRNQRLNTSDNQTAFIFLKEGLVDYAIGSGVTLYSFLKNNSKNFKGKGNESALSEDLIDIVAENMLTTGSIGIMLHPSCYKTAREFESIFHDLYQSRPDFRKMVLEPTIGQEKLVKLSLI